MYCVRCTVYFVLCTVPPTPPPPPPPSSSTPTPSYEHSNGIYPKVCSRKKNKWCFSEPTWIPQSPWWQNSLHFCQAYTSDSPTLKSTENRLCDTLVFSIIICVLFFTSVSKFWCTFGITVRSAPSPPLLLSLLYDGVENSTLWKTITRSVSGIHAGSLFVIYWFGKIFVDHLTDYALFYDQCNFRLEMGGQSLCVSPTGYWFWIYTLCGHCVFTQYLHRLFHLPQILSITSYRRPFDKMVVIFH